MAIFKSAVFSKLRKSFGNVTMYELNGENVLRAKTWKKDPKTPAQLAQRTRMKAARELAYRLLDAICVGFPAKNYMTSINKFISRNIGLMIPDENHAVTYDVTRLQLSSGELLPPAVTAVIDREGATVVFTQERQPLRPLAPDKDRVYGIIWMKEEDEACVFPLQRRCEPGSIRIGMDEEMSKCSLEVFAFTVSANGKKTSQTIWLTSSLSTETKV